MMRLGTAHLRWPPACVARYCGLRPIADRRHQGEPIMPAEIADEALEFLLARAGLDLSPAEKAELKTVYAGIVQMAQRVRHPRGRMAEPAHVYNFTPADLD